MIKIRIVSSGKSGMVAHVFTLPEMTAIMGQHNEKGFRKR